MKYRMEMLNQVQYADDEIRKKELEAKGFHVVSTRTGASGGAGITEGSAEAAPPAEKPEETVKAVKNPKKSKGSRKPAAEKKTAAEEKPEDAGTDREPEAAGGEDQDAG